VAAARSATAAILGNASAEVLSLFEMTLDDVRSTPQRRGGRKIRDGCDPG
jgi:hypothetical protein